jgi:hypothetical protein
VHSCNGNYRVTIYHKGKTRHIGMFDTEAQGRRAYRKAARELRGDFACRT